MPKNVENGIWLPKAGVERAGGVGDSAKRTGGIEGDTKYAGRTPWRHRRPAIIRGVLM